MPDVPNMVLTRVRRLTENAELFPAVLKMTTLFSPEKQACEAFPSMTPLDLPAVERDFSRSKMIWDGISRAHNLVVIQANRTRPLAARLPR